MMQQLGILAIPIIALVIVLGLFIFVWLVSRNYIKVPPNTVAVLSGRKRKLPDGRTVGYRLVPGGAVLRIPLLERVDYLSLNVLTIPLEIRRAYTLKGVPVTVKAVANVKVRSDDTSLQAAAERLLQPGHGARLLVAARRALKLQREHVVPTQDDPDQGPAIAHVAAEGLRRRRR